MKQTDLSTFNNEWYSPGSKLKVIVWFVFKTVFLNNYLPIPVFLKVWILRRFGAKIGNGVMIKPSVNIKYPWFLEIGDHTWIGEKVWIDNDVKVVIADHCCVSQGALLITGNHDYTKPAFDLILKPITIETGAWVGAKSVVCPGVRCGSHSVLTVGSIATKNLEPYSIYQGNPAIIVKKRNL